VKTILSIHTLILGETRIIVLAKVQSGHGKPVKKRMDQFLLVFRLPYNVTLVLGIRIDVIPVHEVIELLDGHGNIVEGWHFAVVCLFFDFGRPTSNI
jgi:hypothetical protein